MKHRCRFCYSIKGERGEKGMCLFSSYENWKKKKEEKTILYFQDVIILNHVAALEPNENVIFADP